MMSFQKLTVHDLVKSFGRKRVVDGISLSVGGGEVVGLLGPNGAGKTTTFYMIVGLLQPEGGKVLLGDMDVGGLPMYLRARKGLSYLPQEPSVFRKLTVEENVLAILETLDTGHNSGKERASSLLRELGLHHLAHQQAYTLSGGERRKLEITRALATSPAFILLDEPFAGIDPIAVDDLQTMIKGLKGRGIGVLISDHNVRDTLRICDRAYIIDEGKIVAEGDPQMIVASRTAREVYLGEKFEF